MTDGFRITKVKHGPLFDMEATHLHPMYEIYYLLNGARRMFFDGSIYVLNRGDLIFIPMNTIHKTTHTNDKPHERIVITFNDKPITDIKSIQPEISLKKIFYPEPVVHLSGINKYYAEEIMERMLTEYGRQDEFSDLSIKNYLQELIIFLIRSRNHKKNEYSRSIGTTDRLMESAAKYIRDNCSKNLSLEEVAGYVNISPTYFSKKFKASTGFGYREYLIIVRIREASAMLLETNKSITEIALECGFNNSSYFGDVFKRIKGVSPFVYRKNNKYL